MEFDRVVSFLHLLVKTSQILGYVALECVGFLPFTSPNTLVSFTGLSDFPTLAEECCAFPRMNFIRTFSFLLKSIWDCFLFAGWCFAKNESLITWYYTSSLKKNMVRYLHSACHGYEAVQALSEISRLCWVFQWWLVVGFVTLHLKLGPPNLMNDNTLIWGLSSQSDCEWPQILFQHFFCISF